MCIENNGKSTVLYFRFMQVNAADGQGIVQVECNERYGNDKRGGKLRRGMSGPEGRKDSRE